MNKKAFLGLGFGPEGVPIDVVPLHLLGRTLPDFKLLVVDEFAKFNSHDAGQEIQKLEEALDRLDGIYGETNRMKCSDFMGSRLYEGVLHELQPTIEFNEELRNLALETVPPKYRNRANVLDYTTNEIACVAYLYLTDGIRLKIGPDRERLYDELIRSLSKYVRYTVGYPGRDSVFPDDLEFGYTIPAFSLRGKPITPYTTLSSSDRIFLNESEQDVVTKLITASEKGLRYFATIGCVASSILGRYHDIKSVQTLDRTRLLDVTADVLINGIIRPYNGVVPR